MAQKELIKRLRLGASISRDRKMNEDYAAVADEAADAIEALQARVTDLEERLDCDRATRAASTASTERYMAERDAALAKLEALEKQEPFAYYNEGIEYHTRGKIDFHKEPTVNLETRWWTEDKPLYASPVPVLAQPEPVEQCWRPIETAPKDGEEILGMYMHIDTQIVHSIFWLDGEYGIKDGGWWTYEYSEVSRLNLDGWMTPTHWMPLPELEPKQ